MMEPVSFSTRAAYPVTLIVPLALCIAGCADRSTSAGLDQVTIDTLSSGIVHVHNRLANPDRAPADLRVRPVFRLGSADGADVETTFGRIQALEVDGQGNVYVLDRDVPVVRVFDSAGKPVRSIGRRGEGPGEFSSPGGLFLDGEERLWVQDRRRYSVFERGGALAATYNRPGVGGGYPVLAADGVIYEDGARVVDLDTREMERWYYGVVPDEGSLRLVSQIDRPHHLIPEMWQVEYVEVSPGLVVGGAEPVPFTPRSHDAIDPRGGFWFGNSDALRFIRYSMNGDTLRIVERAAVARQVTVQDRRLAIEELEERFQSRLQVDERLIPSHMPYWQSFFVDAVGRLWVERFRTPGTSAAEPGTWEIYDSAGVYLGALRLQLSGTPTPVVRGNHLVGTVDGALGEKYVVLYELAGAGDVAAPR